MAWPKLWSARDRAELSRLRDSEARYRLLTENARDLILQMSPDTTIEYASPSIAAYGYSPDDLVGRKPSDFFHPDDAARYGRRNVALAAGEELSEGAPGEYRLRCADGTYRWTVGRPTIVRDADGRMTGLLSIVRDVTEQKLLEDQIAEREARYRQLAETVSDVILQYDAEAIIEYVSPSVRRFGYTPQDLIGRSFAEICDPENDALARRLALLKSGGELPQGAQNEFPIRCADGTWAWVEGNPTPIRDAEGRGVRIITVLRDITERRRLEGDVADSERRYRLLAEQSPDIIIRYDVEGRVEYVSPAIRRYGTDPDRLIGQNVGGLISRDQADANEAWMADLAAGRPLPQGRANVWRTPVAGGGWVDWEGATNPLVEDGKVIGAVSVLRDVTERVALEAELRREEAETQAALERARESETRYRELADNVGDVIVRTGMDGTIEFVSPSIRFLGYRPEDMVGRHTSEFILPEDYTGETRRAILADEPPPQGVDNEFRLVRPDGTTTWMQSSPSAIRDGEGRPIAVVSALRDITERRALEDELRRKRAEAEAAVIAKAEFLANMSHEIRTPLTAVVGFAGLLAKIKELPEKARVYVERIGRSGEALTSIVNNVLDFSKVEAGQVELRPEPINIRALVDETLGVVEDDARGKGLTLAAEAAADLPEQIVADSGRLRQVMLNLLTNAIKFTHEGGVTLALRHDLRMGRLHVEVRDTGIGIAPELSGRLFERFSQVESSSSRRFGGVGLGLAISKGLVELMGGQIGLRSAEGEGSTLWFEVDAPAQAAESSEAAGAEPVLVAPQGKVLVVDDARPNRELILALLGTFDLQVTEACDGLQAVEAAAREAFDLILMDLQMPGMDGMAATRAIRRDCALNGGTPILAVSASVLPADVEACREAGMDGHIPKPINPRELLTQVARWTARSEAAAERVAS